MSDKIKPKVQAVTPDKVIKAEWNYKTEGTEADIEKLMLSIKEDESAGVLAVRELDNGLLEVMDGNHRLEAIKRLGWPKIAVENFGKISLAKAVTIARRRNHSWFEDDLFKLGNLYKDVVVPELGIENLALIMPDTLEDINNLVNLGSFDWEKPVEKVKEEPKEDSEESEPDQEEEDTSSVSKNKNHLSIRLESSLMAQLVGLVEGSIYDSIEEYVLNIIQSHIDEFVDSEE